MSTVWDDPELGEEEVTPLPEIPRQATEISLNPEQLERLASQIIERVAREIIPDIAERIVREEIARLTSEEPE